MDHWVKAERTLTDKIGHLTDDKTEAYFLSKCLHWKSKLMPEQDWPLGPDWKLSSLSTP